MRHRLQLLRSLGTASAFYWGAAFLFMLGAGAAHVWGQVAFVAVGGLWLILSPPRSTPHRFLNLGCVALLTWTLGQLLPGLAQASFWREHLAAVGLLEHPSRPAISAWEQGIAVAWLLAAVGWTFTAIEHLSRLGRTPRRDSLRVFASLMAVTGFFLLCDECRWL